jgi:Short C-terminal domain
MKDLTSEDLSMNQQAASVAASVTGDAIEVAARCEQCTQDMQLQAFGVGGINRGFIKASKGLSRALMPRTMGGLKQMETGGLPNSFVLAASANKVYAIEDKHDGGSLVPGKILMTWDRANFSAKRATQPVMAAITGVPDDRQLMTIYIPLGGTKSKYMEAAARITEAAGSPGQPHQIALAKDDASNRLIDAVVSTSPMAGANIMIGGQSVQEMMAQAQGAAAAAAVAKPDPADQLSKLADLHERGVLNDEEFAAQKAKILGS